MATHISNEIHKFYHNDTIQAQGLAFSLMRGFFNSAWGNRNGEISAYMWRKDGKMRRVRFNTIVSCRMVLVEKYIQIEEENYEDDGYVIINDINGGTYIRQ